MGSGVQIAILLGNTTDRVRSRSSGIKMKSIKALDNHITLIYDSCHDQCYTSTFKAPKESPRRRSDPHRSGRGWPAHSENSTLIYPNLLLSTQFTPSVRSAPGPCLSLSSAADKKAFFKNSILTNV